MTRYYCGRIGGPVTILDGECPECGAREEIHRTLPDDVCGTWARCTRPCEASPHDHGHLCSLPLGHEGPHGTSAGGES